MLLVGLLIVAFAFHHFFFRTILCSFSHLLRRHLFLIGLHLSKLLLCVLLLLHLIGVHFLAIAVLGAELLLVLAALSSSVLVFVFLVDLVLELHSIATDVYLVWLRYDLIADDARLAIEATQVLDVSLQLMYHDVVELTQVVDVPVVVHGLVLSQIVLDQVNLLGGVTY